MGQNGEGSVVASVTHFMVHQQGKLQKHQAFEAEVQANSGAIVKLDETGNLMISEGHFASETIRTRLMELHRQWELLLEKMREKGIKLLQAQKLVQYLRECEDVMDWINDKVRFEKEGLLGRLLERMEVVCVPPPPICMREPVLAGQQRGRCVSSYALPGLFSSVTRKRSLSETDTCVPVSSVLGASVTKRWLVTPALLWSPTRKQL